MNDSKKDSRPGSEHNKPRRQALPITSPIFDPGANKTKQSNGSSAVRKSQRNSERVLLGSGRNEFGPDVNLLVVSAKAKVTVVERKPPTKKMRPDKTMSQLSFNPS